MKLSQWLKESNTKTTDFAEKVGVSVGTISNLANDKSWLGRDLADKICEATSGAVTPNDFLDITPQPEAAE